jgi:hypothetical protein
VVQAAEAAGSLGGDEVNNRLSAYHIASASEMQRRAGSVAAALLLLCWRSSAAASEDLRLLNERTARRKEGFVRPLILQRPLALTVETRLSLPSLVDNPPRLAVAVCVPGAHRIAKPAGDKI